MSFAKNIFLILSSSAIQSEKYILEEISMISSMLKAMWYYFFECQREKFTCIWTCSMVKTSPNLLQTTLPSNMLCHMLFSQLGKSQSNPEIDWILLEMDHCWSIITALIRKARVKEITWSFSELNKISWIVVQISLLNSSYNISGLTVVSLVTD